MPSAPCDGLALGRWLGRLCAKRSVHPDICAAATRMLRALPPASLQGVKGVYAALACARIALKFEDDEADCEDTFPVDTGARYRRRHDLKRHVSRVWWRHEVQVLEFVGWNVFPFFGDHTAPPTPCPMSATPQPVKYVASGDVESHISLIEAAVSPDPPVRYVRPGGLARRRTRHPPPRPAESDSDSDSDTCVVL